MSGSCWNDNWRGKPKYTEKTCSSATVFTSTLTCLDLASNPGLRGGNLTTIRLNYSTVLGPYVLNYDINRKSKKTQLFIHLIKHYATMMYWGVEVQLLDFDTKLSGKLHTAAALPLAKYFTEPIR
jgi:hypothetical protein